MASLISWGVAVCVERATGSGPAVIESVRASQDVGADLDPASVFWGASRPRLYE